MSKNPGLSFHTCSPEFKIHYQCSQEVPGFTLHCFLWVANRKSNITLDMISLLLPFLNHFYCSVSAIYQQGVSSRKNGRRNYSMQDMFAAIFPVTYLKLGVKIAIG